MLHRFPLDFVLSFCREAIPEHGEDSYCYSFCDSAGMLGVFDGCGGAGARTHACFSGRTEAYMASRLCAGIFYDSFRHTFPSDLPTARFVSEVLAPAAVQTLKTYAPTPESGYRITGSMVRTLPSTAAAVIIRQEDTVSLSAIWAGDSRVYLLDEKGLAQLSSDDSTVPDPLETLYEDGVLQNILCVEKPVKLHCKTICVEAPFLVFSATDGCFGYVSTPMEFEGMLLETLLRSASAAQWEAALAERIGSVAGDDHTLCLGAFGYGSFPALQKSFQSRYRYLQKHYLAPVSQMPVEDMQSRYRLWKQYRTHYFSFWEDRRL